MRHVLFVTHSGLAEGFLKSCAYFLGDIEGFTAINAFTECTDVPTALMDYFSDLSEEDEVIAFTDILFGSVNQYLSKYLGRPHFHLISGCNLPIVLEVLTKPASEYLSAETVEHCVERCRDSIVYMNHYKPESNDEDE